MMLRAAAPKPFQAGIKVEQEAVSEHERRVFFTLSTLYKIPLGHRSLLHAQLWVLNTLFAG